MITNKNMSSEDLLEKLLQKVADFERNPMRTLTNREAERFTSLKNEVLSRMNKKDEPEIMTPEHEKWVDFCEMLSHTLDNIEDCDDETLKQSEYILTHYFQPLIQKNLLNTSDHMVDIVIVKF